MVFFDLSGGLLEVVILEFEEVFILFFFNDLEFKFLVEFVKSISSMELKVEFFDDFLFLVLFRFSGFEIVCFVLDMDLFGFFYVVDWEFLYSGFLGMGFMVIELEFLCILVVICIFSCIVYMFFFVFIYFEVDFFFSCVVVYCKGSSSNEFFFDLFSLFMLLVL